MRIFRISTVACMVLLGVLFQCKEEESPFMPSKEAAYQLADSLNNLENPFHYVKNVVAIIDNDIYYFHKLDEAPQRLTNTPADTKTDIKLSADRSLIAYLNKNGNPVIVRADNGSLVETLSQYNYINQMDWAKDRNTLYMLTDNKVVFHGETLTVTQPLLGHPWDDVKSFSMNSKGDQGYFIKHYGTSSYRLEYRSSTKGITKTYTGFDGDLYDYIDFFNDEGDFLIGHYDYLGNGIESVAVILNYEFFPRYQQEYVPMSTPVFNASHEILIYGTIESASYHRIKAVFMGDIDFDGTDPIQTLDYVSKTPIYLDWVQ